MTHRYYLAVDLQYYITLSSNPDPKWREVTKEEFVRAERAAGFHNTQGQPHEPATSAFSGGGLRGKTEYVAEEVVEGS